MAGLTLTKVHPLCFLVLQLLAVVLPTEGHPVFVLRLGAMDVPGLLKAFGELALLRFVS